MRKLLSAFLCVVFMAGIVVAAEVTLVKFDAKTKEVTVKDGEKEVTYKVTAKTKISTATKDGAKDLEYSAFEKMATGEKAAGRKMDITTDKDTVTEIKLKGRGKKNN
jgi:hypothetical protein